jgi:hypothetical protein
MIRSLASVFQPAQHPGHSYPALRNKAHPHESPCLYSQLVNERYSTDWYWKIQHHRVYLLQGCSGSNDIQEMNRKEPDFLRTRYYPDHNKQGVKKGKYPLPALLRGNRSKQKGLRIN